MTQENILAKEETFHDEWADSIDVTCLPVDEAFEACTAPENRCIIRHLGDVRGKKVLELGAGAGESSVYLAKCGADVVASDISQGMLDVVTRLAGVHGVEVGTQKASAEELPFEDGTFDVVYAGNVLHHVDLDKCLAESSRVLKSGGVFVSWDPLRHNPLINLYRRIATKVRTEDEHPLGINDLDIFRKHFSLVEYEAKWFVTLYVFIKFFLTGVDPNKERYWKKIITDHKQLKPTYSRLEKLDDWLLRKMPFLRRYCWNVVVVCRKK